MQFIWKSCQEKASSVSKEHCKDKLWCKVTSEQTKIYGTLSFGQTKPKRSRLAIQHNVTFSKNPNTARQHKHFIPAVKHSGEGVVIWAVLQPQDLRALQSLIWTPLYTTESKVRPSVQRLKLGRNLVMRRDKDQILSGGKRKEWRCYKMLQQRSQNSEHNPNEILLRDLKGNAHRWMPTNLNDLKKHCREAWAINSSTRSKVIQKTKTWLYKLTRAVPSL